MKTNKFFLSVLFFQAAVFLPACASKSLKSSGPVVLSLNINESQSDRTRYYSHSLVQNFEAGQIVKKRDEIVDFTVHNQSEPLADGTIKVLSKTIRKDGMVDLHDLAFPERDEEIEFVFAKDGSVVKAGSFPKTSVFYMPPLPFPDGPVEVGETWDFKHSWLALKNNMPLEMNLVVILKGLYRCGSDTCADLEVSGEVSLLGVDLGEMGFKSEVSGRILYALKRSTVLWSEIQSREDMRSPESSVKVASCLSAQLLDREGLKWSLPSKVSCQPDRKSGVSLP